MRERIKQVMADTFGLAPEEIPDNAAVDVLAQWDSLCHLELMLALEMAFGVFIPSNVMPELVSLEAIEDYLRERAGTVFE